MRVKILFLLLFCSFYAVAQEIQFDEPIGWGGKKIELNTISDKNKQQTCTIVVSSDSIRAFVFNNQVQVVKEFRFAHKQAESLLGGFFRDGRVYLFTQQPGKDELHNWVLTIETGAISNVYVPFDIRKEKPVTQISGGDHLVYLASSKKTAAFILYDFTSEQQFSTLEYTFDEATWSNLTNESGEVKVKKVDLEGECSLDVAVKGNKLYYRNDTAWLIINQRRDTTLVYNFDLLHQKTSSWLINHKTGAFGVTTNAYSDNAFLLRNKLYYVMATADTLCVQVVDLYTGRINKTFQAVRDEDISFKNTPIIQEGTGNSKNDVRELEKTRQLLRKMTNGDAVITATQVDKNQVEVLVGSYAKVNSGGGGIAGTSFATSGAAPMVFIPVPVGGVQRNGWTKSARFKMLLQADGCTHMEGVPGKSINERIENYTTGMKIPPEGENLFMADGHYYYACYNKQDRKLTIIKFRN